MKSHILAIGALGAAFASVPAQAEIIGYEDSIECSALYAFLAFSVEGEPQEEVLDDLGTRWLVLAMTRDGTEDGSRAGEELAPRMVSLGEEVEELADDQTMVDQFLTDRVLYCEAIQQEVADEFDTALEF